jgi:hypothetical protein
LFLTKLGTITITSGCHWLKVGDRFAVSCRNAVSARLPQGMLKGSSE